MLILAHRGYHAHVPENTMAAFEAAVALGVNGIETDVRQTCDGELVLIHDRLTKTGKPISHLTKPELEQSVNHRIPTLREALECWPNILWNIEIKTTDALVNTISALKFFERTHQIFLSSFRHDIVIACAAQTSFDCGLLMASRPASIAGLINDCLGYTRIRAVVWDFNILDESLVLELRSKGWRNFVYGPATLEEHHACVDLGLDGIITDYPGHILNSK